MKRSKPERDAIDALDKLLAHPDADVRLAAALAVAGMSRAILDATSKASALVHDLVGRVQQRLEGVSGKKSGTVDLMENER